MNQNYKTVLLTVLTLSVFTIAIIELTGVSSTGITAFINKFHGGGTVPANDAGSKAADKFHDEAIVRSRKVAEMPKTTMEFYETKYNFGNVQIGRASCRERV